ncbi:hypothetical protein ACHAXS_011829 [Conticribra weissflogii]
MTMSFDTKVIQPHNYDQNEIRALRSIFDYHSKSNNDQSVGKKDENDKVRVVYLAQMYWIIQEIGKDEEEVSRMKQAMEKFQASQQSQQLEIYQTHCLASKLEACKSKVQNGINGKIVAREHRVSADCITFDSFLIIINEGRNQNCDQSYEVDCVANSSTTPATQKEPVANADKIGEQNINFLRVLEEYRMKCVEEGNYLHAQEFLQHVRCLRQDEESRQLKYVKTRHLRDKCMIVEAHEQQVLEFNKCEYHIVLVFCTPG